MGRRRLYHTAEDKLAANRAKSKRHYEKYYALFLFVHYISDEHYRVKNIINERRRRKYQKDNQKK